MVSVLDDAVLGALQSELLTPGLAQLFIQEFQREVARLSEARDDHLVPARARIEELDREIENSAKNSPSIVFRTPSHLNAGQGGL